MSNFIRFSLLSAVVGMLGLASIAASPASVKPDTRLEGRLSAAPSGLQSGKAKFESRDDRTRFSCEVEDVAADGEYTVKHNGATVGTISVALGFGDLNLDTRDGQSVPNMMDGDSIEVFAPGGAKILSGTISEK